MAVDGIKIIGLWMGGGEIWAMVVTIHNKRSVHVNHFKSVN